MKRVLVSVVCVGSLFGNGCSSTDSDGPAPGPDVIGAPGVVLNEIVMYQGPKRVLMSGGQGPIDGVPLIAGRDALFRVFHSTTADYDGQPVTATLDLLDGQPPLETTITVPPQTAEGDLGSTITFQIPGARMGNEFAYSLEINQAAAGRADNQFSRFAQKLPVLGKANVMRVMIVPYAYNADGSGRVPDTSPEQLERYRERFLSLYPVSDVEVTAHAPIPWSSPISGNGGGWQEVGLNLYGLRGSEGIPNDVYLYGVFMPTDSLGQFCGGGCLLGVTLLNNDPPDVGQVGLRLALGVGFPQVALNTAAHELGHAHGRGHADCGPGLDPQSIDPAYPHQNGSIGDWGYDITNGELHDPAVATDIMSYCNNQFISGYNYTRFFDRAQNVNLPSLITKPTNYWLIAEDGVGGKRVESVRLNTFPSGREVDVTVDTRSARGLRTKGWYTPYDHMDGGWLFIRGDVGDVQRIEHTARGTRSVVER